MARGALQLLALAVIASAVAAARTDAAPQICAKGFFLSPVAEQLEGQGQQVTCQSCSEANCAANGCEDFAGCTRCAAGWATSSRREPLRCDTQCPGNCELCLPLGAGPFQAICTKCAPGHTFGDDGACTPFDDVGMLAPWPISASPSQPVEDAAAPASSSGLAYSMNALEGLRAVLRWAGVAAPWRPAAPPAAHATLLPPREQPAELPDEGAELVIEGELDTPVHAAAAALGAADPLLHPQQAAALLVEPGSFAQRAAALHSLAGRGGGPIRPYASAPAPADEAGSLEDAVEMVSKALRAAVASGRPGMAAGGENALRALGPLAGARGGRSALSPAQLAAVLQQALRVVGGRRAGMLPNVSAAQPSAAQPESQSGKKPGVGSLWVRLQHWWRGARGLVAGGTVHLPTDAELPGDGEHGSTWGGWEEVALPTGADDDFEEYAWGPRAAMAAEDGADSAVARNGGYASMQPAAQPYTIQIMQPGAHSGAVVGAQPASAAAHGAAANILAVRAALQHVLMVPRAVASQGIWHSWLAQRFGASGNWAPLSAAQAAQATLAAQHPSSRGPAHLQAIAARVIAVAHRQTLPIDQPFARTMVVALLPAQHK